jgi:hypothetical protein
MKRQGEMKKFSETISDIIVDDIQIQIGEHLFSKWHEANLKKGAAYSEFQFFAFAEEDIKAEYNEYYGYEEDDEFYL